MLLSPMKIGNVDIKNRVVMAPMQISVGDINGCATEKMMDYYEERAKGGVGMIITEITRVNDMHGAATFNQLGISHDYHIAPLAEMAKRIHKHGTKLFVQLHHPGRQNLSLLVGLLAMSIQLKKVVPKYKQLFCKIVPAGKWLMAKHIVPPVYGPSKVEVSAYSGCTVRALSNRAVKKLIGQFIDGAERVKKAGCDGVELHASHGYLIQQFLSPHTNRRTDEYGGSLENRMRFLMETIDGIRTRCGADFPIIVRLTVDEFYEKVGRAGTGYTLEEGVIMAKLLSDKGIDAIDVSSGAYDTMNYWLEPISFPCGWRAYLADAVKKVVDIPVIAANLIRSPEQAEEQLQSGIQDFISLGRPHLADPEWTKKVAEGRANEIKRCISCLNCFETMQKNAYIMENAECAVNPCLAREKDTSKMLIDGAKRKIIIVGAGPAGLATAEVLAKRDFDVTILEKSSIAGGQLQLANKPLNKDKINWCYEDLLVNCKKNGAEIMYNTEATKELIESYKPYAVIVATGGVAIHPMAIKGADRDNVCTVSKILDGSVAIANKKVAVIGSGMTGLESSELLASQGNEVSIIEMADSIAPGVWAQNVDDIKPKLREAKVEIYTSYKLMEINDDGILIQNTKDNSNKTILVDYVILSIGVRPEQTLFKTLEDNPKYKLYLVGDSNKVGRIANAIRYAYDTAVSIK